MSTNRHVKSKQVLIKDYASKSSQFLKCKGNTLSPPESSLQKKEHATKNSTAGQPDLDNQSDMETNEKIDTKSSDIDQVTIATQQQVGPLDPLVNEIKLL